MYSVSVTDRMMYSHTFVFDDGKPFTTGCTSVVTASFEGKSLGPYDILIDIVVAQKLLREVLSVYDHKNLDEIAEFQLGGSPGLAQRRNTTVEVMAKAVFDKLRLKLLQHIRMHSTSDGKGFAAITGLHVKLQETDVASASYGETNSLGILASKSKL